MGSSLHIRDERAVGAVEASRISNFKECRIGNVCREGDSQYFLGCTRVLLVNYLEKGCTTAGAYYVCLLWQQLENIKKYRHGKWLRVVSALSPGQCSSSMSTVAMAAIHECDFELVDHSPFSPDLSLSE